MAVQPKLKSRQRAVTKLCFKLKELNNRARFITTHFGTVQQVAVESLLPQTFAHPPLIIILQ